MEPPRESQAGASFSQHGGGWPSSGKHACTSNGSLSKCGVCEQQNLEDTQDLQHRWGVVCLFRNDIELDILGAYCSCQFAGCRDLNITRSRSGCPKLHDSICGEDDSFVGSLFARCKLLERKYDPLIIRGLDNDSSSHSNGGSWTDHAALHSSFDLLFVKQ